MRTAILIGSLAIASAISRGLNVPSAQGDEANIILTILIIFIIMDVADFFTKK